MKSREQADPETISKERVLVQFQKGSGEEFLKGFKKGAKGQTSRKHI